MENKKRWIYLIIAIIIIFILLFATSMVGVTVLDTQSINNITLQINIT